MGPAMGSEEKRQLVQFLVQNLVLDDRQLKIELKKPFDSIEDLAKNKSLQITKRPDISSGRLVWLGRWDSNPRPIGYTYP